MAGITHTLAALLCLAGPASATMTNSDPNQLAAMLAGIETVTVTTDPLDLAIEAVIDEHMASLMPLRLADLLASQTPRASQAQVHEFGIGHMGRLTAVQRREMGDYHPVSTPSSIWLFSLALTAIIIVPVMGRLIARRRAAKDKGNKQHTTSAG